MSTTEIMNAVSDAEDFILMHDELPMKPQVEAAVRLLARIEKEFQFSDSDSIAEVEERLLGVTMELQAIAAQPVPDSVRRRLENTEVVNPGAVNFGELLVDDLKPAPDQGTYKYQYLKDRSSPFFEATWVVAHIRPVYFGNTILRLCQNPKSQGAAIVWSERNPERVILNAEDNCVRTPLGIQHNAADAGGALVVGEVMTDQLSPATLMYFRRNDPLTGKRRTFSPVDLIGTVPVSSIDDGERRLNEVRRAIDLSVGADLDDYFGPADEVGGGEPDVGF